MAVYAVVDSLDIDDLKFAVRVSSRRRTIGITVHRTGALTVALPVRCSLRTAEAAVRAKLPWVRRKLAEMEHLSQLAPPKKYVDGELFPYLGRRYRLSFVSSGDGQRTAAVRHGRSGRPGGVQLRRGRFELEVELAHEARTHMIAWYTTRGQRWIEGRLAHYAAQLGVAPTAVRVRDMGQRWGSCSARGRVSFHWRILAFPPSIIDYVIVHELAHLRELNHSRAFWGLVETVLPDYRRRKTWLAREGHAAP